MVRVNNIWIVDDDDIYTRLLKKSIAKLNLASTVNSFENGKVALESLHEQLDSNGSVPDVILLDVNMPVVDGWGFIEEYSEISTTALSNTDVYFVSSSIASEDRQKAVKYKEVKDYIVKPIDAITLVKIIDAHRLGGIV